MAKNTMLMTLPEIEDEIEGLYRWWHETAPGVSPREHGRLAELWKAFDFLVKEK